MKFQLILCHWLGIFLAVGCAVKAKSRTVEPNSNVDLMPRAQEIIEQAPWCDNMPVYDGDNNVTKRPLCNGGDSMLWSGLLFYSWPEAKLGQAIRQSIAPNGKPYRSPEHLKGGDSVDEFSRDMYIGFLFYCLKSKDFETCTRVHEWTKSQGYKLCGGTISQCGLLPSVMYSTYAVWDKNGWSIAPEFKPNNVEQGADAQATFLEAKTAPKGYRLHLVSLKVFLMNQVGRTGDYYLSARELVKRQPENLWFQFVAYLTGESNDAQLGSISRELSRKMNEWNYDVSYSTDWYWQGRREVAHDGLGQDFVFLACLVNGVCDLVRKD